MGTPLEAAESLLAKIARLDQELSEHLRALMQLTAEMGPEDRAHIEACYQFVLTSRKQRFDANLCVDLARPVEVRVEPGPSKKAHVLFLSPVEDR